MATSDYNDKIVQVKNLRPLVRAMRDLGKVPPVRTDGEYANLGLHFAAGRDGLVYTVRIPKYSAQTSTGCTKLGANAGLTCTPSTSTVAGQDDYAGRGPFRTLTVCGYPDADGMPHVTHIEGYGDGMVRTGETGNVLIAAPTLYWMVDEQDDYTDLSITDTPRDGFSVQPGGTLPDGTVRPFMLYAKYPGGMYGGKYASVSGVPVLTRTVSHNTLLTLAAGANAGDESLGWYGKTHADHWYVVTMFLMKYANKSSQSVFAGCTGYYYQYTATASLASSAGIVISSANAANLVVGSAVDVGSLGGDASASKDRARAHTHDLAERARIVSIEDYDASNRLVVLDCAPFASTSGVTLLSTMPWNCGACDSVLGRDGSPVSASSAKNPFAIQGIELAHGAYEVMSNVVVHHYVDDGAPVGEVCVCADGADGLGSTANYAATGVSLERTSSTAGWVYQADYAWAGGMPVGVGAASGSSVGTGDATYSPASTASDWYEFLGLGALDNGGPAGLSCAYANSGLSYAPWPIAGRLSANGRSAA